jgi:hypothetical protein
MSRDNRCKCARREKFLDRSKHKSTVLRYFVLTRGSAVHAQHPEPATIIIEGIMARRTIEQRLAQLDAQKKILQARLGKQERARDTRRKVLLGALVLHRLQSDQPEASAAWLRTWLASELPAFLTRDMDTELLADLVPSAIAHAPASPPPAASTA